MKRRDKFIETEQGMKVMKTWLMKNVTIMSNVFIKVRLCRVYVCIRGRTRFVCSLHTVLTQCIHVLCSLFTQATGVDVGASVSLCVYHYR